MAERFAFPVRCGEGVMRRAVSGFVTRALFREAPLETFLISVSSHFIALPLASAPREALEFLDAQAAKGT